MRIGCADAKLPAWSVWYAGRRVAVANLLLRRHATFESRRRPYPGPAMNNPSQVCCAFDLGSPSGNGLPRRTPLGSVTGYPAQPTVVRRVQQEEPR